MEKDLISIIIPVYNVEKYLEKCIESVIRQTYRNIEILLVDDESKDTSGIICDRYKEKDERIRVIHKKNGGVSSARNIGLKEAKGNFIMFVDSDDWIEKDAVSSLVKVMNNSSVDMVQGVTAINDKVKNAKVKNDSYNEIYVNDIEDLKLGILNYKYKSLYNSLRCVTAKLFKAEIIKKYSINFPKDIYLLEDGIFIYQYLNYASNVVFINKCVYNYVQVESSASHRYNVDQLYQYKKVIEKFTLLEADKMFINYTIFEFLMTYISRGIKQNSNRKLFIKNIKNILLDDMYKKCIKTINIKFMHFKELICYCLLKFKLYSILYFICLVK